MKRTTLAIIISLVLAATATAQRETGNEPWRIINMEDVSRHGGNCEFDDETCTATFRADRDRWIDIPGLRGDLSEHTNVVMNILKSDCLLKVAVRYKDADGKTQQADCCTFYRQMGKPLTKAKDIKFDLTGNGKIPVEWLRNVVSIRIAMAKPVGGLGEPWQVKFGKVLVY